MLMAHPMMMAQTHTPIRDTITRRSPLACTPLEGLLGQSL
jgi:hypothetical protein